MLELVSAIRNLASMLRFQCRQQDVNPPPPDARVGTPTLLLYRHHGFRLVNRVASLPFSRGVAAVEPELVTKIECW